MAAVLKQDKTAPMSRTRLLSGKMRVCDNHSCYVLLSGQLTPFSPFFDNDAFLPASLWDHYNFFGASLSKPFLQPNPYDVLARFHLS